MRGSEAGFSLIEVTVAAALFAVVAIGALEAVRQLAANVRVLSARRLAYASVERTVAQLRAEARSATAVWIGSANGGGAPDGCVQVDFFTTNAAGPRFWSYRQFPNHADGADALERLAGTAPLPACDPALHGDVVLSGLTSPLILATVAANALATHRDPYDGDADSPFVAASVPATAPVALDVLDANGTPVNGGNAVVELRLDTAEASRTVDLLPGTLPGGFTEVLRYTCSARCDVGHDGAAPKTLTTCVMSWQTAWSEFVRWSDYTVNADGSLAFPGGWFIAGTFAFTYGGTRASDGGADALVKTYAASNWDAARDYAAFPPDRPSAVGTSAGGFAPWDVRDERAATWLGEFGPYLAAGESAPIAAEQQRCDAVQQQGENGGFYANG